MKGWRSITVKGHQLLWLFIPTTGMVRLRDLSNSGQSAEIELKAWKDPWINFPEIKPEDSYLVTPKLVSEVAEFALESGELFDPMALLTLIDATQRSGGGSILRKQTTYVDVAVDSEVFRVKYHRKREFEFVSDGFHSVGVFTRHPLLLDYIEPMTPIHLASSVRDSEQFRKLLEETTTEVFGTWRTIDRYLNLPLDTFLEKSYGLLMTAPKTFAGLLTERAAELGIKLIVHEGHDPGEWPKALIFGSNFVIADDFRVEPR